MLARVGAVTEYGLLYSASIRVHLMIGPSGLFVTILVQLAFSGPSELGPEDIWPRNAEDSSTNL